MFSKCPVFLLNKKEKLKKRGQLEIPEGRQKSGKRQKLRWSRNDPKVDKIEHRGHQIEDFDSKINISRSKYVWKAEKNIEN